MSAPGLLCAVTRCSGLDVKLLVTEGCLLPLKQKFLAVLIPCSLARIFQSRGLRVSLDDCLMLALPADLLLCQLSSVPSLILGYSVLSGLHAQGGLLSL